MPQPQPDIVTADGVRMRVLVSDCHEDGFIRGEVSLLATAPDGVSVKWTLPLRLVANIKAFPLILTELRDELEERRKYARTAVRS